MPVRDHDLIADTYVIVKQYGHMRKRYSALLLSVMAFAGAGITLLAMSSAATSLASAELEAGNTTGRAAAHYDTSASGMQSVRFGTMLQNCNNLCSTPANPVQQTAPVAINTNVNAAWCGPSWDAPQAEYDSARQKMGAGAILAPPCKSGGGFITQTPEQYRVGLDKAQKAGVMLLVWGGLTCSNPFDHNCYKMYTDPDAVIDQYAYHPALAGFFIVDEPSSTQFAKIQGVVEKVRQRRPGLLAYVNLFGAFGSMGSEARWGNITYDEYIRRYISTVKTTLISIDDYISPQSMEYSLSVVDRWARHYQSNGRPELINRVLWSAISTVGGHSGHDTAYFQNNMPIYKAANDKYNARYLYFTWRAPPPDDFWKAETSGTGLCGRPSNMRPGTMCGE